MSFYKDKASELAGMAEGVRQCRRCDLHLGRNRAVFGEGPIDCAGLLLGEAPGEAEDLSGRPFVGRTGRYLDSALVSCDLQREDLFITSAVKCRPPGNRNPTRNELLTCRRAWLKRQIGLIDPPIILVMGKIACFQVLEKHTPLQEIRGKLLEHEGRTWLLTYHPTAAMRFPRIRALFEQDLKSFKKLTANRPWR